MVFLESLLNVPGVELDLSTLAGQIPLSLRTVTSKISVWLTVCQELFSVRQHKVLLYIHSSVSSQRFKRTPKKIPDAPSLCTFQVSCNLLHKFQLLQLPQTLVCFLHPERPLLSLWGPLFMLKFGKCSLAESWDECQAYLTCFPFSRITIRS